MFKCLLIKEKINYVQVFINKGIYYLDLEEKVIAKSNDYKILRMAYDKEMDYIKGIKRSNRERLRKCKKKLDNDNFSYCFKKIQPRSIIRNNKTFDIYYVVKSDKNVITCVSSSDINKKVEFKLYLESPFDIIGELNNIEYQNLLLQCKKNDKIVSS